MAAGGAMLNDSEAAELRALHKQVYGRAGEVSAHDLDRLRVLGQMAQGSAQEPVVPTADSLPEEPVLISEIPAIVSPVAPPQQRQVDEGSPTPAVDRPQPRPRWWMVVVAAVVAAGIGVLVGWSLTVEPSGDRIRVSAAEEERRAAFYENGAFDDGSIRALGREDATVAWMATRLEGETVCLIVDDEAEKATNCIPREQYGLAGLWISYVPADAAADGEVVNAELFPDTDGTPRAHLQRMPSHIDSYLNAFEPPDRRTAEWLLEQGADQWSGEIAGRVGEDPIWLVTRKSGQQLCLLYAPDPPVALAACAAYDDIGEDGLSVWVAPERLDDPNAALEGASIYREIKVTPDAQRNTPVLIRDYPRAAVDTAVELTEPVDDLEDAVRE